MNKLKVLGQQVSTRLIIPALTLTDPADVPLPKISAEEKRRIRFASRLLDDLARHTLALLCTIKCLHVEFYVC